MGTRPSERGGRAMNLLGRDLLRRGAVAGLLVPALLAACNDAGSCQPAGRAGGAPLGAACASDCDCATTNCYQGSCLPRAAWVATYLSDTSSQAQVVAATAGGLFVS